MEEQKQANEQRRLAEEAGEESFLTAQSLTKSKKGCPEFL